MTPSSAALRPRLRATVGLRAKLDRVVELPAGKRQVAVTKDDSAEDIVCAWRGRHYVFIAA